MSPEPKSAPGHVPFGRATAGATPKQRVLFRLMRERVHLIGAYQGLSAAQLVEPMAEGAGSVRDALALVAAWEVAAVDALPAARAGVRPAMMGFSYEDEERWRAEQLAHSRALALEDVMRGLQLTRLELLDQLEVMPEEPAAMWEPTEAVGWLVDRLARNDREQADAIKRWRAEKEY